MKKKPTTRKGKTTPFDAPVEELSPNGQVRHYSAILLENIESKMETVIEKVTASEINLNRKIDDLRDNMNKRFKIVEGAIKINAQEIRKNREAIERLELKVQGVEDNLSRKIDRIALRVDNHETRITNLENPVH